MQSDHFLAQLWREYGYADSRYLTKDATVFCIEATTAVSRGARYEETNRGLCDCPVSLANHTWLTVGFVGPAFVCSGRFYSQESCFPASSPDDHLHGPALRRRHLPWHGYLRLTYLQPFGLAPGAVLLLVLLSLYERILGSYTCEWVKCIINRTNRMMDMGLCWLWTSSDIPKFSCDGWGCKNCAEGDEESFCQWQYQEESLNQLYVPCSCGWLRLLSHS